jgi:hypothetical protein
MGGGRKREGRREENRKENGKENGKREEGGEGKEQGGGGKGIGYSRFQFFDLFNCVVI